MPPFLSGVFDDGLFVLGVLLTLPRIAFSLCDGYGWWIQIAENQIPDDRTEPGKAAPPNNVA